MVWEVSKWPDMVREASTWSGRLPNGQKWLVRLPNGLGGFPIPNDLGGFQMARKGLRGFHMVWEVSKWPKMGWVLAHVSKCSLSTSIRTEVTWV